MSVNKKKPAKKAPTNTRRANRAKPTPRAAFAAAAWTPASMTTAIDAVWDQPDSSKMTHCAAGIPQPNQDCNCFLKNAARGFFAAAQAFDAADKSADDIIAILANSANGWTEIADSDGSGTKRTAAAIAAFNSDNKVVIAGMTSTELGKAHGHVALVVKGTETAGAANLVVPKCTAGSINSTARVKDKGVNWSFGKLMPRKIRYFWRAPDSSSPVMALARPQTPKKRAAKKQAPKKRASPKRVRRKSVR